MDHILRGKSELSLSLSVSLSLCLSRNFLETGAFFPAQNSVHSVRTYPCGTVFACLTLNLEFEVLPLKPCLLRQDLRSGGPRVRHSVRPDKGVERIKAGWCLQSDEAGLVIAQRQHESQ